MPCGSTCPASDALCIAGFKNRLAPVAVLHTLPATWFSGRFLVRRSTREKNLERHMVSGKVLGAKVDSQKGLKRHIVFWEGSWREGRLAKKLETLHGFLGRFLVRRSTQRKNETATCFVGRFWVGRLL